MTISTTLGLETQRIVGFQAIVTGDGLAPGGNGFGKDDLQSLPMEFAMEAQSLVAISLEGSVG